MHGLTVHHAKHPLACCPCMLQTQSIWNEFEGSVHSLPLTEFPSPVVMRVYVALRCKSCVLSALETVKPVDSHITRHQRAVFRAACRALLSGAAIHSTTPLRSRYLGREKNEGD